MTEETKGPVKLEIVKLRELSAEIFQLRREAGFEIAQEVNVEDMPDRMKTVFNDINLHVDLLYIAFLLEDGLIDHEEYHKQKDLIFKDYM